MLKITLTENESTELKRMHQKSNGKNSLYALIIILIHEKNTPLDTSKILKLSYHTIIYWIKKYKTEGIKGLKRNYSPGRPSLREKNLIPNLKIWLEKSPSEFDYNHNYWTVALIIDMYKKTFNAILSEDTVQRGLKDAGYSFKRPKKTVPITAPSKEEKKAAVLKLIEEIKEEIKNGDTEIVFIDESHISTEPYISKGWFLKNNDALSLFSEEKGVALNIWKLQLKNKAVYIQNF